MGVGAGPSEGHYWGAVVNIVHCIETPGTQLSIGSYNSPWKAELSSFYRREAEGQRDGVICSSSHRQ